MKSFLKGILLVAFVAVTGQAFFEGIVKGSVKMHDKISNNYRR